MTYILLKALQAVVRTLWVSVKRGKYSEQFDAICLALMVGTKTLKYGTALMPSIVKGIVGSFPGTLDACLSSEEQYRRFFNVPIEGLQREDVDVPLSSSKYPSVSVVLGCTESYRQLWFWQLRMIKQLHGLAQLRKYMRERVALGLRFHAHVKNLLVLHSRGVLKHMTDEELCGKVDRPLANYIKSALPLLRSFDETGKTVVERFVIHPQLYYCGRFDAIIKYKDVVYLVDFKTTSNSFSQAGNDLKQLYSGPLQVAAYVGAANCTPSLASISTVTVLLVYIKRGALVVVKEDGSTADFIDMDLKSLEEHWSKWISRVHQFWVGLESRPVEDGMVSFVYDGRKEN
ncbi:unnamed protein product [Enterobius vermicularis]|uniref:Mitochondrial genome maintenance exonuclease 1 n=1 Tax=Enterobius vermicularis TaxID=51028 RepID=A0A0N4UYQ2_ENTVE|nr:unnamed protein product [Enterobius vermicularis]